MPTSKKKFVRSVTDMSGRKFGRWLVLYRAETPAYEKNKGRAYWFCRCECGDERVVRGNALRNGQSLSCGCLKVDRTKETQTIHGQAIPGHQSGAYMSWHAMIRRCLHETSSTYPRYGGRGVTVCERWNDFQKFLEDMGDRPPGMTLDRFPNGDGNYEPGNCRWATRGQQQENRKITLFYEFGGRRLNLSNWAIETGIPYKVLRVRLRALGWSVERALTTEVRHRRTICQ